MREPLEDADHPRRFPSHRLVQVRPGVYVFEPALSLRLVPLMALLPGTVILLFATLAAVERPGALVFAGVGAVLVWAGLWARGPVVRFDLAAGHLVRGYPWRRTTVPLSSVAALELVPAGLFSPEDGEPYETFQLNVVRVGAAQRINLTNHADRAAAVAAGRELAAALGVAFQEHRRSAADSRRTQ